HFTVGKFGFAHGASAVGRWAAQPGGDALGVVADAAVFGGPVLSLCISRDLDRATWVGSRWRLRIFASRTTSALYDRPHCRLGGGLCFDGNRVCVGTGV